MIKLTDILLKEDGHGEGYEEGNVKLLGDVILPIDKKMVLQAEEDKYNRGLLVTNNKDKSYDIAYWADEFKPYPIEVEIDGKSVAKEAKVIKLLFHPEMNESVVTESKGAKNYFDDLKFNYQKAFRYLEADEKEEYKQLVKDYFSK
jgi:hypothetical protein